MNNFKWTATQTLERALRFFFVMSSVILYTSFLGCDSAFSQTSAVAFEISCVEPRTNQSEAIVLLNFKNQTKTRVNVPFWAMLGKGGCEKNARQFVNLTKRATDFN
jgi:nitrate/TMAO reductase-like tetraheme cytochrome c subunit